MPAGMCAERFAEGVHWAITARRAQVLGLLAENYTEPEIADRLGISLHGVRSHIDWLRDYAGLNSTRELARWWREERLTWLRAMARAAGL